MRRLFCRTRGALTFTTFDGRIWVHPILLLVLLALLYTLLLGGLGALRREGFSLQFVAEVFITAGSLLILSVTTGWAIHPILFLTLLYVVTMRVRLLVDLANLLARRGNHGLASQLYAAALRVLPDPVGRQVVVLNQGVHCLKQQRLDEAISLLEGLTRGSADDMALKIEAGARYNLAVAYQRRGDEAKAVAEFNKVIDVMPGSLYGLGAQKALERGRERKEPTADSDE